MAAMQNAGLALEWTQKAPGAGGVTFLPYLSGERTPHLDPYVCGAWTGLGLAHGRVHLLRAAAFEGVAFALREGLEALEEAGVQAPELRLAGGGVLRVVWRQLLADVLGGPLRLLPAFVAPAASARGAALLAGLAQGIYGSVEETILIAPKAGRPCSRGTTTATKRPTPGTGSSTRGCASRRSCARFGGPCSLPAGRLRRARLQAGLGWVGQSSGW